MTPHQLKPRTVYFIKPVGMPGPVKIGCSASPDGRCSTLSTWSPFALEIIAQIAGDMRIERRFHAAFEEHNERREWFTWNPALAETVAAINAGTFDVETLPEPRPLYLGRQPKRTDDQRAQLSLSLRVQAMQTRSGYACPVDPYGAVYDNDEIRLARVHQYLADPVAHGRPVDAHWAVARRANFIALASRGRVIPSSAPPSAVASESIPTITAAAGTAPVLAAAPIADPRAA